MLTHGLKNTRGKTVCHIPLETPKQPSHTLEVKIQGGGCSGEKAVGGASKDGFEDVDVLFRRW